MIEVKKGALSTAIKVLAQLPEFDELKPEAHYAQLLEGKDHLILIACETEKAIGCKIGYDRFKDGSFYSWLGGVVPEHRKLGVAQRLADYQEQWAGENGYKSIKFKTLNRHKAMLQFAIRNGFEIYNVKPREQLTDYRIELIKELK